MENTWRWIDGCCRNWSGTPKKRTAPATASRRTRTMKQHPAIRCYTGSAVMTEPASYGSLNVPFVIPAVGPDFNDYTLATLDEQHMAYSLLRSAYKVPNITGSCVGIRWRYHHQCCSIPCTLGGCGSWRRSTGSHCSLWAVGHFPNGDPQQCPPLQ